MIMLALIMNSRPVPKRLAEEVIEQIIAKLGDAQAKDVFYICLALGKGSQKIDQKLISADLYYRVHHKCMNFMNQYDLY